MSLTLTLSLDIPIRPMDAKGLIRQRVASLLKIFHIQSYQSLNLLCTKYEIHSIATGYGDMTTT